MKAAPDNLPLELPLAQSANFAFGRRLNLLLAVMAMVLAPLGARGVILWTDLGATPVHESGAGADVLGGAVARDNRASDSLYFKFHVDPLSDVSTEEYLAAFELYEGEAERLALGNSLQAWAYSAFNTAETGDNNKVFGDVDLHSARPESSGLGKFYPYELPRRGIESTIVFKVQYAPGGDDWVTVWLNPDLSQGATEASQPESLTTRFRAKASFNQIRLRHVGGGGGWTFSDMAIATSFSDFVAPIRSNGVERRMGRGAPLFTFRSWQREQGLPQNAVRALAQTREGYLWIGTDDGLARFDGVRFVCFGIREGLRSEAISALLEDRAGALWIGTVGGGLSCRQHGKITTLTQRDGLPADSITALAEDSEGRLWVGTEAGLVVWQKGGLAPLKGAEAFQGKAIAALLRDRHGTLWLGATGAGVFRFDGERFIAVTDLSVAALLRDPHCLLLDQRARLWVGAGDDFVLCKDGEQWRRYRIPRHLARPYVSALVDEGNGTVWAGSVSEGLFQFGEGKPMAINASSGLSDNSVLSLLADREGNFWVGTGAGLNRLRRSNLSTLGQNEGLGYGAVQGLAEIEPGVVWAGKPGDGLFRWTGTNFTRLTPAPPLDRNLEVNCLLLARDGSCWVGTAHKLLRFKNPKAAGVEAEIAPLPDLNVLALAEDRQQAIWAGTREGELWRLDQGKWARQTNYPGTHAITAIVPGSSAVGAGGTAPSRDAHAITAVVAEASAAVWVGTEGEGVYRFNGAGRAHLDKNDGLLSDLIRTLCLDKQGTLWIGTAGGGLARWRAGRLTSMTVQEGLPDNTISQIVEDDFGRLWLGSNHGLACIARGELDELMTARAPSVYPRLYGRADGMLSEECTGGFCPAGLRTQSGLLWFSTSKGIAVIDPRPQPSDLPAPPVVLEDVLVNGILAAPTNGALRLAADKRRLEFHYTGLDCSAPERVRFRYRLEGLDADWIESASRVASYNYVPPGNYRFRVIACNGNGLWNQAGAGLALTVLPHLWQEWWFIGAVALALLLSGGGVVRRIEKSKLHRRLEQLERERALERERTRIAQDLHDDLGSSLTRIMLLCGLAKEDGESAGPMPPNVNKISQSAAQTLRALDEIVWALRPGSDTLQGLVEYVAHFANELFEGDGVHCRLDLPHDLPPRPLPPEMRHNLFLIVKEALTNALKHAGAREVHVQAKASAAWLEILVQDDGQGFDPSRQSKGNGLANMRRRAEVMGARLSIQSIPGKGTAVQVKVDFAASTSAPANGQ